MKIEMNMISRTLTLLAAAVTAGATALVLSVSLEGQVQTAARNSARAESSAGADVAQAFVAARMAKNWTPSKTPWGDPDVQGNFTSKDLVLIPYQRPKEFEGRRMEDIAPEELGAASAARFKEHVEKAAIRDQGPQTHWRDSLFVEPNKTPPWFIIDPADGKSPPMTAEAKARAAAIVPKGHGATPANSYKDLGLWECCIVRGIPPSAMSPGTYGNSYQILQTPDYVAIRYEMGLPRLIPLDGRPYLNPSIRSYYGDSRGYWDGNTLVIETTNFRDDAGYRQGGLAYWGTGNVRLIERFTRSGPRTVEWTVTLDDPTIWTRHWTFSMPLTEDDAQMIHEYACHEGNYGLVNNAHCRARGGARSGGEERRSLKQKQPGKAQSSGSTQPASPLMTWRG